MYIISKSQVKKLFSSKPAINEVKKALISYSKNKTTSPPAFVFDLPNNNGEICIKTALIKDYPTYTIKLVSVFKSNKDLNLPTLTGTMNVFCANTGKLQAVINEQGWLTNQRTACAGTIADKYFKQKSASTLGVIGTGKQAEFQLKMCLSQANNYTRVYVWNRTKANAKKYISKMKAIFPATNFFSADNLSELIKLSNTIITTTSSTKPLIKNNMINKGTTIIAVGADMPQKCELDPKILAKADKVFVDSIKSNISLGEISQAIKSKTLTPDKITGEIGEVISGKKTGRKNESEIIIIKLVGIGAQDTAIANYIFQKYKSNLSAKTTIPSPTISSN